MDHYFSEILNYNEINFIMISLLLKETNIQAYQDIKMF